MAWTIILEFEDGSANEILSFQLDNGFLNIINLDKYKFLKYIDPYGDTTFNILQIDDLIDDFKNLIKEIPQSKREIEGVIELAFKCKNEVHHYLKFYGD